MRIAIDINNVIRNTFLKAEQIYQKYYIDNVDELEDGEFEYELNLPVTDLSNLIDNFKFPDVESLFRFFYEEFPMEIFGHSPSMDNNTFNTLNEIYEDLRDEHDLLIISDEISKSKPATLFFLSKYGCLIEKVKFFSKVTLESIWDECDLIITSNPELLDSNPKNKIMVKVNSTYNLNSVGDYTIDSIDEFTTLYKKLNLKNNDFVIGE